MLETALHFIAWGTIAVCSFRMIRQLYKLAFPRHLIDANRERQDKALRECEQNLRDTADEWMNEAVFFDWEDE